MFDFEKLTVYEKAKEFHLRNENLLKKRGIPVSSRQQLHRASLSVILNLAEGSGRFTKPDRRNFYIISRSSVFECIALLDILNSTGFVDVDLHKKQYSLGEELSRIILAMIKGLN